MQKFVTKDKKYMVVEQDGDNNLVIYPMKGEEPDLSKPIWDRHSYEAVRNISSDPDFHPNPTRDPIPIPSIDTILLTPVRVVRGCNPIGMSYWRNINNHRDRDQLYMVLSISDELYLFTLDKRSLLTVNTRPLGIRHTGEGVYFSTTNPVILYVPTDQALVRLDVEDGRQGITWDLGPGRKIWQCHSSYEGNVHSATIKNNDYQIIKWGVYDEVKGREYTFPIEDQPDECQIDQSGKFLLTKQSKHLGGDRWDEYNKIINLADGSVTIIHDDEGAIGHSDCGFGCAIGEYDKSGQGGTLNRINFVTKEQDELFATGIWNMGYVSFTNARPNVPLGEQRCLMSTPDQILSVKLNGGRAFRKICDNFSQSTKYEHRVKANLCPLGQFAAFTAFVDGELEAYIVGIPDA